MLSGPGAVRCRASWRACRGSGAASSPAPARPAAAPACPLALGRYAVGLFPGAGEPPEAALSSADCCARTVTRKAHNRLWDLAAQRRIQYYSSGTDCRVTITTCMPFGVTGFTGTP